MKRRGFFGRLLGLAAVPFVPAITPKEKNDSFVGDGLDHKCIDCVPYNPYRFGPMGPISTKNTGVATSGSYSVVFDPTKSEEPGVVYYTVSRGGFASGEYIELKTTK